MQPARSPDPAQGVFETLLVADGRPVELDAHWSRLARSHAALFGGEPPAEAREKAIAAAAGVRLGRLRITIAPGAGGGFHTEVRAVPVDDGIVFPSWENGARLVTVDVAGGLGSHKWADRSLLGPGGGEVGGALALLIDGDEVLEAARANVFAAIGGIVATPPVDGRILPGIARHRVIELAASDGVPLEERAIARSELLEADEAFLTGSVRGVEPVRSLDGIEMPRPGPITERLSTALRRLWLAPRPSGLS